MVSPKHRLVTRSDFDGLVCGMLLRELDLIDEIKFVHPKDMQDGIVPITSRDIVTNLPYVEGCHLAFDHHASEVERKAGRTYDNHVIDAAAPSAARVVYNYYGGAAAFPQVSPELMAAVDKADSAQFSREEILDPQGWVLLNFLMDSRTGLGRFRDFRISNYDLMMQLIESCRDQRDRGRAGSPRRARARGALPVAPRPCSPSRSAAAPRCTASSRCIDLRERGGDLRGQPLHGLRPVPRMRHLGPRAVGREASRTPSSRSASRSSTAARRSTWARSASSYGGGGHEAAGTCQVSNERAEAVKHELIAILGSPPNTRLAA